MCQPCMADLELCRRLVVVESLVRVVMSSTTPRATRPWHASDCDLHTNTQNAPFNFTNIHK